MHLLMSVVVIPHLTASVVYSYYSQLAIARQQKEGQEGARMKEW